MKKLLLFFVISVLLTMPSVSQSKQFWRDTKLQNSISAYTYFLKEYPTSKYSAEAKRKLTKLEIGIDSLSWSQADSEKNTASYSQYLENYPTGIYSNDAKRKLAKLEIEIDSLDWVQADFEKNMESYYQYLDRHKNGKYANFASNKLNDLLKNALPLTEVEIVKIKDVLQLLAIPLNLYELQSFNSDAFDKFSSKSMQRPSTALYTYYFATGTKLDVMTISSSISFMVFSYLSSHNGMPPKDLDPQILFSLLLPDKNNINTIGFNEVKIYKTNNKIQDHLIFINEKWYKINN